jgi:uncharacterized protein
MARARYTWSMPICPICTRPVGTRAQNKAFPFCSARCRQVDLGCWLDEKYRIPPADAGETESDEKDAPLGPRFGEDGPGTEAALHEAGEDQE